MSMSATEELPNLLIEQLRKQSDVIEKLLEKQNATMERIEVAVTTLEKHSSLDHDDQPFPVQKLEKHEPAWRAVFETLTTKMKQQVNRWRNGMDSTLIFVALFVTVITSFQGPVSQNLSQNPVDLTNTILHNLTSIVYEVASMNGLKVPTSLPQPVPFEPARSDEIVTLFWYPALLLSLITAIFSVFGRQWVEHLTKKPEGQTYKERSMRLDFREKLANKLLRPILDSLHPILILSIVLFICGLLYQLWSVASSVRSSRLLQVTSVIGTLLILVAGAVTIFALLHGIYRDESPFSTSSSGAIRSCVPKQFIDSFPTGHKWEDVFPLFCRSVTQMAENDHIDQISTVGLFSSGHKSWTIHEVELAADTAVHVLGSDASWKAKQTVAWNLFSISSRSLDHTIMREPERIMKCYRKLHGALRSAYLDTPSSQKKIELGFLFAQMVVLLRFSGEHFYAPVTAYLHNTVLKEVFLSVFMLRKEKCVDKSILDLCAGKYAASIECVRLKEEDPHLFHNIIEDYPDLLPALTRDDGEDRWKDFILPHLEEKHVTRLLGLISTASQEKEHCLYLFSILHLTLRFCVKPFVFPEQFHLSNMLSCSKAYKGRKDEIITRIDVLLSYFSLMNDKILGLQEGLFEFLEELPDRFGLMHERPSVANGVPPVNMTSLIARVRSLKNGLVVRTCSTERPLANETFQNQKV